MAADFVGGKIESETFGNEMNHSPKLDTNFATKAYR